MNANELADNQLTHVIGENNNGEEVVITLRNPLYRESFVRQQQAEIETYKLELYDEVMLRREQQAEIEALKAHPVKELTDEEIDVIFFDLPSGHSIQEFARAILRKAQEK